MCAHIWIGAQTFRNYSHNLHTSNWSVDQLESIYLFSDKPKSSTDGFRLNDTRNLALLFFDKRKEKHQTFSLKVCTRTDQPMTSHLERILTVREHKALCFIKCRKKRIIFKKNIHSWTWYNVCIAACTAFTWASLTLRGQCDAPSFYV